MSISRHSSRIYSLHEAAGEAPALASLMDRARRSQALLEQLRHRIPPALRAQLRPGPLEGTQWCLLVSGPAAATKLRNIIPLLLQDLNDGRNEVTAIRIKVQPWTR
ncbi:MAG: DciA family protein [Burkholderiaceae bacterium]